MDELTVQSMWSFMCQSALSHAASMARMQRYPVARELIDAETRKFTEQPPPRTDDELSQRHTQHLSLTSRIGTIAHADTMVRMNPDVAEAVFDLVKSFCGGDLPSTADGVNKLHLASLELTSKISSLCHADSMQRLRGSFRDQPDFDEVLRLGREFRSADQPHA
jgi:hypothetical protein